MLNREVAFTLILLDARDHRRDCRLRPRREPSLRITNMKKKRRGLAVNPKSLKMLEGVARGLSLAEAGRRAGYAHTSTSYKAFHRLKLLIPERLDALGCPVDKVLMTVISKLEATETKMGWHKGKLIDTVNVVDHDTQLRAADMILELCNAYPGRGNRQQQGDDGETETRGPTFTLAIADPTVAERVLEKLAARKGGDFAGRLGELDEDQGRAGQ